MKNKHAPLIILVLTIVIFIVWNRYKSNERKTILKKGMYTICYIDDIQYSKSIPYVTYHYFFKGQRYEGNDACSDPSLKKNYIGKFVLETKEIVLLCDCPIEDKDLKAPESGWKTLPEGLCK